ncbi:hypothetical protein F4814DRAFT_446001 [Daldinia grandis]|nr:hypothetical protein F4814DRAFT_446001 [Daldinia grandis]
MGEHDRAILRLEGQLKFVTHPERGSVARIRLALASAYLMKLMREILSAQPRDRLEYEGVQDMYHELESGCLLGWMDQVTVALGIAILKHLSGESELAIRAW